MLVLPAAVHNSQRPTKAYPEHLADLLPVLHVLPVQTSLAVEREERVAEDDEIVAAVNDYTRALQDGLRILANS